MAQQKDWACTSMITYSGLLREVKMEKMLMTTTLGHQTTHLEQKPTPNKACTW
jgi:hypothetical protein